MLVAGPALQVRNATACHLKAGGNKRSTEAPKAARVMIGELDRFASRDYREMR